MEDQLFAVVDVETTGGEMAGNRLTEICVVLLKGSKIIEKYSTLIDPEIHIPVYITALTDINNNLVGYAPKFHEVANKMEEFTRGAIFVAHNVNAQAGKA
jgi:DNA polymerase-3 subunit epsilon